MFYKQIFSLKALVFALTICFFLLPPVVFSQTSPVALGKRLVASLKDNNEEAFLMLVPTQKEIERRNEKIDLFIPGKSLQKKFSDEYLRKMKSISASFKKTWNAIAKGEKFQWLNMEILRITKEKKFESMGSFSVKTFQIQVYISDQLQCICVEIPKAARSSGKWKLIEEIRYSRVENKK
jgi:hypothetical protein